MYGIVSMLINLAYDPITKLKDKKRRGVSIFLKPKESEEVKRTSGNFISSLLSDNFEVAKNEADSDLSEWTESEDDDQMGESFESIKMEVSSSTSSSSFKPPQKMQIFEKHKIENAEKWLKNHIQHSWWSPKEVTSIDIVSSHSAANFCLAWQKHLSRSSMGFIKPQPTSLLPEYCLLREILWMFINANDCKFFKLENEEISLRSNVTMPSTSTESLHIFLADFVTSMNFIYKLNRAVEKSTRTSSLSHTLEKYFNLLQEFLDEIRDFVLMEEEAVKGHEATYTVLSLHSKFQPHFKVLAMLWDVHKNCIIDDEKFPAHIQSTYLVASLNHEIQNATCKEKKNLCLTFLVTCLKTFLDIFDIWWTEARLQDLKNEFIVERVASNYEDLEIIEARLFEKCKEKSFYINDAISKRITSDTIITAMNYFASEASFTLEIIAKLDRIHEMKQMGNECRRSLYEEFIEKFQCEIDKFSSCEDDEVEVEVPKSLPKNKKLIDDIKNGMMADGDDLMLMIFNSTFENLTVTHKKEAAKQSNLQIFRHLNKSTSSLLMPLEQSIERIIRELLAQKISIAEGFVMNIYFHEFMIELNLQEIRKVFFLDSSELMNFFTFKIFAVMEAGDSSWANPYLLTTAFNEVVGSARQIAPLFVVNVNRKLVHYSVLDAIDEITLCVNMNHHQDLDNILTSQAIQKFNDGESCTVRGERK